MAVSPAVGLIASPLGGHLSDRLGRVRVTLTACFVAIPAIFLLGAAPTLTAFIAVMVLVGAVSFFRMATSEAYLVERVPVYRRATILGIYYFAGREAGGLLSPAIGKMMESIRFFRTVSYLSAALAAVNIVCALVMWRNRE
jgi:MHS family proline/betaine transporter-like MFS transporter